MRFDKIYCSQGSQTSGRKDTQKQQNRNQKQCCYHCLCSDWRWTGPQVVPAGADAVWSGGTGKGACPESRRSRQWITALLTQNLLQGLLSLPAPPWSVPVLTGPSRLGLCPARPDSLRTGSSQVGPWQRQRDPAAFTFAFVSVFAPACAFILFCCCFCFRFCLFTFFFFYFFFFLIILSFILFLLSFFSYLSYVPWRPFCPWWTKYANGAVFRSTISITGIFTTQTDHRQQTDILSVYLSVYHRRSVAVIAHCGIEKAPLFCREITELWNNHFLLFFFTQAEFLWSGRISRGIL